MYRKGSEPESYKTEPILTKDKMNQFDNYRAAVLRDYEQRKGANQLPLNLSYPTVTSLKDEALNACQNRFQRSDEKVLVAFFKQQVDVSEYLVAINKSDADCFKPIYNFLRGVTTKPEEKQVEMLAWLTDFKHRPYQEYLKSKLPAGGGGIWIPPGLGKLSLEKFLVGFAVLVLLVAGYYVISAIGSKQKYMHWTGDRYELVSYATLLGDPSVIPYDPIKLAHFRMITRYDTLTAYSLGKVWYVKRKDEYEFYTSDGVHPENPDLKLKPLNDYMLNTVVRQKKKQLLLNDHQE
jgi:hypothetical protein